MEQLRESSRRSEVELPMELELTYCPDCGLTAEVIDRAVLPSTDGPVEHIKTRCITGHWYMTPAGDHSPRRT
jgi:hypothetical protein